MGVEASQKRVLDALLDRHPALVPVDELRAELADVHDIDRALTVLIADGLVTRSAGSWVPAGSPSEPIFDVGTETIDGASPRGGWRAAAAAAWTSATVAPPRAQAARIAANRGQSAAICAVSGTSA